MYWETKIELGRRISDKNKKSEQANVQIKSNQSEEFGFVSSIYVVRTNWETAKKE